jgi:hypothetical protein
VGTSQIDSNLANGIKHIIIEAPFEETKNIVLTDF